MDSKLPYTMRNNRGRWTHGGFAHAGLEVGVAALVLLEARLVLALLTLVRLDAQPQRLHLVVLAPQLVAQHRILKRRQQNETNRSMNQRCSLVDGRLG